MLSSYRNQHDVLKKKINMQVIQVRLSFRLLVGLMQLLQTYTDILLQSVSDSDTLAKVVVAKAG